jgi:hypothetical protein
MEKRKVTASDGNRTTVIKTVASYFIVCTANIKSPSLILLIVDNIFLFGVVLHYVKCAVNLILILMQPDWMRESTGCPGEPNRVV